MKSPLVIERYRGRPEAEPARSALTANGIDALVVSDDAGGQYPGLGFTRGVDLVVETDDRARAEEILGTERPRDAEGD